MRIRGGYVVLCIAILIVGLVVAGVIKESRSHRVSEDEFLANVRTDVSPPPNPVEANLPGLLPPVRGEDQTLTPKIEAETTEYDTGIISNSEVTTRELKITNQGSADLIINKVRTTCGCTKGSMETTTLLPGASALLKIEIDPFRIGMFESKKTLTIESNDPIAPMLRIGVTARVDPEVSIEPERIEFGDVSKGEPHEKTMLIRQLGDQPLVIQELIQPRTMDGIELWYEEVPVDQRKDPNRAEYRIKATLLPDAPVGPHQFRFTLRTGFKRLKQIPAILKANVTAFYNVQPRNASVGPVAPGDKRPGLITVTADRPIQLSVLEASEEIEVSTRPGDEPNSAVLDLKVQGNLTPGVKRWRIRFAIKSGDQTFTETANVSGMVRGEQPGQPPIPPLPAPAPLPGT